MKRHSSNASANQEPHPPEPEWDDDDPTWQILSQASTREPNAFFARNVVRSVRLLDRKPTTWRTHIVSFFTPRRLALGAAACACAIIAYPMWPTSETQNPNMAETPSIITPPSSALSELVIEETLDLAAEDPTLFTHDEVVAMIGF
ncbi:MAG: hypothetical protein KJO21_01005 [Verrucomicrobiae bacterium]|nr:hypothetical protein [Verrucomicrobiae bacterium]NNJ42113.1 hypothetical protein [Akkermansiaceae bacterium]